MRNLIRYEPLFTEPFEDFFRQMFKPVRWELEGLPKDIRVDVSETDTTYTVKADLPGVKKDDISVEIDGNVVTISAAAREEKEVKEHGKVIRSERYRGSLQRSFSLGHDIDEAAATAKLTDGTLELTLPKKATSAVKTLAIH
ncbi:MAG TPA: Hsp20/alpha crystallin family protein [Burkholderiales bacterium]|nr:Hsp20/alpha crystallin family protein [Burkholderiales bacterium]